MSNSTPTVGYNVNLAQYNSGTFSIGSCTSSSISLLTGTTTAVGSLLISSGNGLSWSSVNDSLNNHDMIEFYELLLAALGYDITYDEFSKMTKQQRKGILREIKINRVLGK